MRCAADRPRWRRGRRRGRRPGRPPAPQPGRPPRWPAAVIACAAAACLLAACTSPGKPAGSTGPGPGAGPGGLVGRGGGPANRIVAVMGGPGGGILVAPGTSGSSGRPKLTVPPIPPASSSRPINLPLSTYADVAILQQSVLSEADTLLTQKCMSAKGFDYSAEATPSQEQALVQATEYGYGVSSTADASSYGYGQPGAGGPAQQHLAFLGGFASFGDLAKQPRAWIVALLGFAPGVRIGRNPPEGCLQEANQVLYGPGGNLTDPVPSIAIQAGQWTQSDPRILAVDAAWSRCMARRGYKYGNPQQAAERGWPAKPTSLETATAVADATCKQQVDYVNTWLTIEAAYQAALVGQNLSTLSSLQQSFKSMLNRAQALLTLPQLPVPRQLPIGGRHRPGVVFVVPG
jgi:hypothetical protein